MKTLIFFFALLIISTNLFVGCSKNTDEPESGFKITVKDATNITETSFVAQWNLNQSDVKSITIDVANSDDFSDILKSVEVPDVTATSQLIDGLHGATKYYYRLKVKLPDDSNHKSATSTQITSYQKEEFTIYTTDSIKIVGDINYLSGNKTKKPTVILLGIYQLANSWKSHDIFLNLIAQDYACVVFNWRGHGNSGTWPFPQTSAERDEFFSTHTLNDLIACYTYIKEHEIVDPSNLVLMGGSLGATHSLNGNEWEGVKASIALSPSRLGLGAGSFTNVFILACTGDYWGNIDFAEDAQIIYDWSTEPKKLLIMSGGGHGPEILDYEGVNQQIMDWINERMGDR